MTQDTASVSDGTFWLAEDGIVWAVAPPGAEDTLENARASLEEIRKACGGKPRPVLVDIRGIRSATLEARRFWGSEALVGVVSAAALLISSPVSRVLGNFYIGLHRAQVPIRMFAGEAEAVEWLRGFVEVEERV
jgi:hypothetical protein